MKLLSLLALLALSAEAAQTTEPETWKFAVSGDSRNCGDVIMTAIAAGAIKDDSQFYWHLGDFRFGAKIDEDILHDSRRMKAPDLKEYQALEWPDFIENQLRPFGSMPVYLTIGNHELYGHTREEYIPAFHPWIEGDKIYFHWIKGGVDFIAMDNASHEQFEQAQMDWFRKLIAQDEANPKIKTIVVGMHEALPNSISYSHSMSESGHPVAVESGREVYLKLLHARDHAKKKVYVLASHSHFFMEGTFNTPFWKLHGGILPGWIVGTAGAVRYALPPEAKDAAKAETKVYGYLLATVKSDGTISFDFHRIEKSDIPASVSKRYGADFVTWCFEQNAIDMLPQH